MRKMQDTLLGKCLWPRYACRVPRIYANVNGVAVQIGRKKGGAARFSAGDKDDRITPAGRFIRKVRIDELPQLINILNSTMPICVSRSGRPEAAEQYCKEIPELALRLQAKAGLTGYAQVYDKYNIPPMISSK